MTRRMHGNRTPSEPKRSASANDLAGRADAQSFPHADSAPVLLARVDSEGRIVAANRPFAMIFNAASEALAGQPLSSLFGEAAFRRLRPMIDRVLGAEVPSSEITVVGGTDDRHLHFDCLPTHGGSGEIIGCDLIGRDNVLVPGREDNVAEASRSLGPSLAAVRHDLRQPVQAIGLLASALADLEIPPEALRLVRQIEQSALELQSQLNALRDISDLDAGLQRPEFSGVRLRDLVSDVVQELAAQAAGNGVRINTAVADLTVTSDAGLLRRVLWNLVTNAIVHAPNSPLRIAAARRGSDVVLTVEDGGPGISREDQDWVFEASVQPASPARDRARGLGPELPIARRLLRLLGHEMTLHSARGRGTRVKVTLRPHGSAAGIAQGPRSERQSTEERRWILLIEDDDSVRRSLGVRLKAWGFQVVGFGGFAEARVFLDENPDVIDGAIVDYRLSGDDSGIEVIRSLRAEHDIPSVLLTGDADPGLPRKLSESGSRVLHKPVDAGALRSAIAHILEIEEITEPPRNAPAANHAR